MTADVRRLREAHTREAFEHMLCRTRGDKLSAKQLQLAVEVDLLRQENGMLRGLLQEHGVVLEECAVPATEGAGRAISIERAPAAVAGEAEAAATPSGGEAACVRGGGD